MYKIFSLVSRVLFVSLLSFFVTVFVTSEDVHTLQEKETIYQISKKYNIPIEALLEANNISDPTKLSTNRKIIIPQKNNRKHLVEKGDTLYALAHQYNTDVESILKLNKLTDQSLLRVGITLKIPGSQLDLNNPSKNTASVNGVDKPVLKNKDVVVIKNTNKDSSRDVFLFENATASGSVSKKWPVSGNSYVLNGNLPGMLIESKESTEVRSISSGVVLYAAAHSAFRNVVIVQTSTGEAFVYGGQKQLFVKQGDVVKKGTILGELGIMPFVKKAVLYFAVIKKDKYINPKSFIS